MEAASPRRRMVRLSSVTTLFRKGSNGESADSSANDDRDRGHSAVVPKRNRENKEAVPPAELLSPRKQLTRLGSALFSKRGESSREGFGGQLLADDDESVATIPIEKLTGESKTDNQASPRKQMVRLGSVTALFRKGGSGEGNTSTENGDVASPKGMSRFMKDENGEQGSNEVAWTRNPTSSSRRGRRASVS